MSEASIEIEDETKAEKVAAARKCLFEIAELKVDRVVKYNTDPCDYTLITETGTVRVGPVRNLIEQKYFRLKVADATMMYMKKISKKDWEYAAQALLDLCELELVGQDSTDNGKVGYWLSSYLQHASPLYDPVEAVRNHRPYFHEDHLFISSMDLRSYMAMFMRELVYLKVLALMLKLYGFEPFDLQLKIDGRSVHRSLWRIEISKDKIAEEHVDFDLLNNAKELGYVSTPDDRSKQLVS